MDTSFQPDCPTLRGSLAPLGRRCTGGAEHGLEYLPVGMSTRLVNVLAVALMMSVCSAAVGPAVGASPATSRLVHPSVTEKSVLKATFIRYKLTSNAMAKSDHVTWSRVRPSDPLAPLMAYDALDHRYWALANFTLTVPASYRAQVSFQDGGSYGIFYRTTSGPWIMKGYAAIPLCPSIVPVPVARLWHLATYQGC